MTDELKSIAAGVLPLFVILMVAAGLTARRAYADARRRPTENCLTIGLVAVAVHCAHFLEEFLFGFRTHYPELLGLAPWSDRFFVTLNVFWLCVWTPALAGLHYRVRIALWPLWFLGIALAVNALAHTAFSFVARGYFPGLFTVPMAGVAGLLLLRELTRITRGANSPPDRLDEQYWNA